ncbi:dihydrofolate reductase family protein [Vallicoccus soli]|uniref:Dihydrofolate reductase n=1 Tax=Vallicoccus soli TaxID=2339232 RepID=A0A3A3YS11_9ACTN|nr:dihydrofolate reductase family protein [Vallicoccus soli]RJK94180.1 dihydrofolate reductase [Vallicoccus soli]
MPELRAYALSLSLDGYLAGPDQGPDAPLGVGGERLHAWVTATGAWRDRHGLPEPGAADPVDERFAARGGGDEVGATIMGRNMFGPVRGPWRDASWRGWWGEEGPFGHPVLVLTHHAREDLVLGDGTRFRFVTGGPRAALDLAREAAGDRHVRVGGGAATVRQYLAAGLLDELHLAVVPVLLGAGERLFADDLGAAASGYEVVEHAPSSTVTHMRLRRRAQP